MARSPVAVGIDIGGTKLVVLTLADDGAVVDRQRLTSPKGDPDALIETVVTAARELGPGLPVGAGIAGIVSPDGVIRYGPNLDIADVPLAAEVHRELDVEVTVANDATVALVGELRQGAARGAADVVMITLGTGVGGALAIAGRVVEGANGMAGELGHVPVVDGGRPCPCGNRGCLEAYASGTAIGLRAVERLEADDASSTLRDADAVDGKTVTLAALDGDALAREVVEDAGYWLGVGLTGIVNAVDPELIVVGGGAATTAAPLMLPVAVDVLSRRIMGAGHRPVPEVVSASLGDDAGAIGAALIALRGREAV